MPIIVPRKKRLLLSPHVIWAVIVAATLIALYFGTAKVFRYWPFVKHTSSQPTVIDPNSVKNITDNPSPKNANTPGKDSVKPPTDAGKNSDQVTINPALVATITTLNEDNGNINFAATVQNVSSGAGTCVVTFSNPSDRPVTKQFDATTKSGVAACGPVAIPNYEFSFLGKWQVAFRYYTDSQQATAQSTLEIK